MRLLTTWMLIASITISPSVTYSFETGRSEKVVLRNVQLDDAGTLHGQLLNQAGLPLAQNTISVRSQKDTSQRSIDLRTDANGRFAINGLKNGVCVIDSGEETFAFRVWQSNVAPPKSLKSVALVQGDSVQRGQNNDNRGLFQRLGNGIRNLTPKQKALLLAAIAAAIIIPIAADDDDNAS